jgi:hypothetical protein
MLIIEELHEISKRKIFNLPRYVKYAHALMFYFLYCTYSFTECKIKNNSDYRITFKGPGYSAPTANTIDKLLYRGIYRVCFPEAKSKVPDWGIKSTLA